MISEVNYFYAKILKLFGIFFDNLDFKIIKRNSINKAVFGKACFGYPFEFTYINVEPDGYRKVELIADFFKSFKYFVGPGFIFVITDSNVADYTIVFPFFCP